MLFTIFACVYCFVGGLLAAALLTDKHCNTNRKEAVFCFIAGILWPLAIGVAAGFGLFENIKEKLYVKRRARAEKVFHLGTVLIKMKLISKETYAALQKRMTQ